MKDTQYYCQACGAASAKWTGKCAGCGAWNSLIEERAVRVGKGSARARAGLRVGESPRALTLADAMCDEAVRLHTGMKEIDRVLGGGLVEGSVVLLGGEPGVGKCVTAETRVLDPSSGDFVSIEAWASRLRPVLALDQSTLRLSEAVATHFHDQGERPVVKLTTRLGRTLRCTPTHPVLTPRGWRGAGSLAPGTRLAAPRALPYFGNEQMRDDEVERIAYALCDRPAMGRVRVATAISEIQRDLELGAGLRAHPDAATSVKDEGLWLARGRVPAPVFRLPRAQIARFLRVLFGCKGSVYADGPGALGVFYSTPSRCLAEDVQHLLLRFGFVAELRTKHIAEHSCVSYELHLLGALEFERFLTEIGSIGQAPSQSLLDTESRVSAGSIHRDILDAGIAFWCRVREVARTASLSANRSPDPEAKEQGDVYWDEVASIEPDGVARVYDITVPGPANFIANDLVIHNSTLMLELVAKLAPAGGVLYASGEESAAQVAGRAKRLGVGEGSNVRLISTGELEDVEAAVRRHDPRVVAVDSVQTMRTADLESAAGSVAQLREVTARLVTMAKQERRAVLLVGHVTKDGSLAGPKVLEHLVDVVLSFDGERSGGPRVLRALKNRFGASGELAVLEMTRDGLREVPDPSALFLAERPKDVPGSVVVASADGVRPLLLEVQALVTPTALPTPRRVATGIDATRLAILAAVLTQRAPLPLRDHDVFVALAGGASIDEPAADLAVACAIASSVVELALPPDLVVFGEVGLAGEVRAVTRCTTRLEEAAKLGFRRALVPRANVERGEIPAGITAHGVGHVREVAAWIARKSDGR